MTIIKDFWITQNDIKKLFDTQYKFKNTWSVIYEKRMSTNEHFIYYSIPINKNQTNNVYSIIEKSNLGETNSIKCSVLTEALAEYLNISKQKLLYGIRSHRYSERYLKEFGLRKFEKKIILNRKNYFFLVQTLPQREKIERFRAKSMSITFGKYLVQTK